VDHSPSAASTDDARALRCTAGIIAGDPDALADLYTWWRPIMLAWVRRATARDDEFCHDIVHDAVLKVIARAEPIDSASSLGAWLRAVTLRTARDTLRAESRRSRRDSTPRTTTSSHPSALAASAHTEALARIDVELAALTREHRFLLDARFRFGWTLHHTARTLGVKPGLVDGRIRRTLSAMRSTLESPGGDP
jgi:RNA polymerase sigma factor (sigma-70 family)